MLEENHLRTICDGAIEARLQALILAEKTEEQIRDRFGNQICKYVYYRK
jgi:hypothetical protein